MKIENKENVVVFMKKICNFLVACVLLCVHVGAMQSQTNTAYAMPSEQISDNEWIVWGEDDLRNELTLLSSRGIPQGYNNVERIIHMCIAFNRKLHVQCCFANAWMYNML